MSWRKINDSDPIDSRYVDPNGLEAVPRKFDPVVFLQNRVFQVICFGAEISNYDYELRLRGIDARHKSEIDRIERQCDQKIQVCYGMDCDVARVNCVRDVMEKCQNEREPAYSEWAKDIMEFEEYYWYRLAVYRFCNPK